MFYKEFCYLCNGVGFLLDSFCQQLSWWKPQAPFANLFFTNMFAGHITLFHFSANLTSTNCVTVNWHNARVSLSNPFLLYDVFVTRNDANANVYHENTSWLAFFTKWRDMTRCGSLEKKWKLDTEIWHQQRATWDHQYFNKMISNNAVILRCLFALFLLFFIPSPH